MNKEKYIEVLSKVGLNAPESRVYLALIELAESMTGELSKKSDVATSKIYNVLESLIEKGFVGYRLKNNQKVFFASNPHVIEDLLEKRENEQKKEKNELLALIEELSKKERPNDPYSNYKYFEGISGIRALWFELMEDLRNLEKKSDVLVYSGLRKAYESMLGLYEEFHKVRVKNKIKYRAIFPPEEEALAKRRKRQNSEIRFLKLDNEAEWAIVGNKLIIQYITGKTPRGFSIEDKIFVTTFRQVFDQLWASAKK